MDDSQVFITKTPPQHVDAHVVDANETYLFGSRGSLKTWLAGSLYILRRTFEMPRSTGAIVGISFEHLMDNTIPPLKSFLSSRGIIEGEHYVMMQPPPDHWPKPYAGVIDPKYKHAWTWYNGTSIQFISLRRKASANGVSAQWAYFDECKFMDEKELEDDIFPIIRPIEVSDPIFKNCSGYLSKFFSTDKNADPVNIQWLLKKKDLVNVKKAELVKTLQYNIYELEKKIDIAKKTEKPKIRKEIFEDERRLAKLRSKLVYVCEVNADDVRPILGDKWYLSKKRNSKERDWNVIYLNNDPDTPGVAFYPAFKKEKHIYFNNEDIDPIAPFIISSDYQHTVAPMPVCQISKLPGREKVSLNFVDAIHTLYPAGLRDAVNLFCSKYRSRENKQVFYVYDHTAVGKRVDAESYYAIVINELEKHGWIVYPVYTGQAPDHYNKYLNTIDWMENKDSKTMDVFFNGYRCVKLIRSIQGSAAKTTGKNTQKDKTGEQQSGLDQSETTHFSDAFDMILDAVLKHKLITGSNYSGSGFIFR